MHHYFNQYWGCISITESGAIREVNERAASLLGEAAAVGKSIFEVFTWLQKSWLTYNFLPRVATTTSGEEVLLDIFPDAEGDNEEGFRILFRKVTDYQHSNNILCRLSHLTIGLQDFIDTSFDGIVISDGHGVITAVNASFLNISGLKKEEIVGKHFANLVKQGTISYSVAEQAIKQRKAASAIVKYPRGKEAMITSTPLLDDNGKIIRVISNARDITELNALHNELKETKDLVKEFRHKLKVQKIINEDIIISVSRSNCMERLYDLTTKVAKTDLQLLITGESGVGKTTLAKYIHQISERSSIGDFIHINCSSIPESLLESELFGHEEGSFTGAKKSKAGLFEVANSGTLFLDEIGNMPVPLQTKLLNVLQEKKFYRVGGTKEVKVDVRIIAATNADLEQLISEGRFRQDLYYRLNVIPIRIPSLAERKEDLVPLIAYFLNQSNKRYKSVKKISPEVMAVMLEYNWPGNIRELINFIERAVVVVDEPVIELSHLKELVPNKSFSKLIKAKDKANQSNDNIHLWNPNTHLKELLSKLEEQIIEEAIAECGSFKEASQNLGVDVATLFRKRKRKDKEGCTLTDISIV